MSKSLEATCVLGVVTAEGVPVPSATVLSEGVGPSTGVLVLDDEKAFYLAKTSPDLKSTLEQVIAALTQVATSLTTLGAAIPTVTTPPTLAAEVANLTSKIALLTALKEVLK